jgi:demethylspheroidene O-methyltransferase
MSNQMDTRESFMSRPGKNQVPDWKLRWISWRNRVLGSPRFQQWAARNWVMRPFAQRKAAELFDLVAGFTYTQTLLAMVESGLLERLADGPCNAGQAAESAGLSRKAAERLLRAAASLKLAEEVSSGIWMLGERGASLIPQQGAQAMIRHHHLLYRDLADPLALLRQDRSEPTELSEFWRYAARADAQAESPDAVTPYSQLMAASQAMVAQEVLHAYDFGQHSALLDVGGGHGAFISAVAQRHPRLQLGIFDLPGVVQGARQRLGANVEYHGGDFFRDELPRGYDCITLVRILHDHDDEPAQRLLAATRAALPVGGRLVIAEPMAATRGAEAMGEAYFGLYLWAMRSGRPRTQTELGKMLKTAGFRHFKRLKTDQPLITSAIVAFA